MKRGNRSVHRLADRVPPERLPEQLPEEPTEPLAQADAGASDLQNPCFNSELAYDGYKDIEEYDNGAYGSIVDDRQDPEKELEFEDREEDLDMAEENLVDPQENLPPVSRRLTS